MSIKKVFNGKTLLHPGAYSKIVVENLSGFPLSETGIVGIVGEAVGGEPRVLDILSGAQIQDAKARYKSGPIADALELLSNPSRDPAIANGASKVIVYKVNGGTRSALNLKQETAFGAANQVLLDSINWGADENQINVSVAQGVVVDREAFILGSVDGPFTLAGAETLIVRSKATTYTFTNTLTGSTSAAAMAAELNTAARWSGSIKPVIAIAVGNKVKITLDPTVVTGAEQDYGYLKIDPASTIDTILGIIGEDRGLKGSRVLTIIKGDVEEVTPELGGVKAFSIKYVGAGTSCLLKLQKVAGELKLTTVCAGAAGDNLDIVLKDVAGKEKFTLKSLADLIDANAAYEASVLFNNPGINASQLDFYDDLEIKDVAAHLNRDVYALVDHLNLLSTLVEATKIDNIYRTMAFFSAPQFLTGATDGTSVNSDWVDGLDALKEVRVNSVVTLISEDTGPLTIDSINAALESHVRSMWSTDGKSERQAFGSKRALKADFAAAARTLNSEFFCLLGQEPEVLNRQAELEFLHPWAMACLAAGMRAGAVVAEPLTFKYINCNNVRSPYNDWSPKKDYNELIEAGCFIAEQTDSGAFRWVVGNTTYGKDGSFVYNRESVMQAAGFVAYDLRQNLELTFTGKKARTGTSEAIANFIKARMTIYRDEAEVIVGDDLNEGLGYYEKSLRVVITGNTAAINLRITPVQGLDFLLPTIYLADIRQSA